MLKGEGSETLSRVKCHASIGTRSEIQPKLAIRTQKVVEVVPITMVMLKGTSGDNHPKT